jgi:SAM-dependent methyltransferase
LDVNSKVLVLGSTPEIRKQLGVKGVSAVVMDKSKEMYYGMMRFVEAISLEQERFVQRNWMKADKVFNKDYFDYIFADLALRNIDASLQPKFLKKISDLLKPQGYFITRVHFINENVTGRDEGRLIKECFSKSDGLSGPKIEDMVVSRLFDCCTDFRSKIIDRKKMERQVAACLDSSAEGTLEAEILANILAKWSGSSKRNWTQRPEAVIKQFFAAQFNNIDKNISKDYLDAAYYPVFALRR